MNAPQQQQASLTPQQIAQASGAGVQFLNLETTLIPGNIKQQLSVLEVVLQALATGNLQVAQPAETPVESTPEKGTDVDVSDLIGTDDADADQTPS